ncbi:MAG: DUF4346 domain-containing protein [bacterium]
MDDFQTVDNINILYGKIRTELLKGIKLNKCKKCGCMIYGLNDIAENIKAIVYSARDLTIDDISRDFTKEIENLKLGLKPAEYSCFGCKHCYPAVAGNLITDALISLIQAPANLTDSLSSLEFLSYWPISPGEYSSFCGGEGCPVAVSTLASVDLYDKLSKLRPKGLCITGKTETENIGIEKIIKNTISNPTIHYLIVSGKESEGHNSGQTLMSLYENGVDKNMRIIGSAGKRPILKNVSREEAESFRKQVEVINLIGCEDVEVITDKIGELLEDFKRLKTDRIINSALNLSPAGKIDKITAKKPEKIKLDKKGYFVIIPSFADKSITVEHYDYSNKLLNVIKGNDVYAIYSTIIEKGLISELTHAAYIGKELEKAAWCINYGVKFNQDGA